MRYRFSKWLPLLAASLLGVITLMIYTWGLGGRNTVVFLQVGSGAMLPALFPLLDKAIRRPLPATLYWLITLHIVLSCDLGSALGFYGRFPRWDLWMHGYFGFLAGVTLYILLLRWNGAALHPAGFYILILLGTMGGAALWEVFEYSCDLLLGGDAQRVQEALSLGLSPIRDTMTDIIIAIAGLGVFYLLLFVDRFLGFKLRRKLRPQSV